MHFDLPRITVHLNCSFDLEWSYLFKLTTNFTKDIFSVILSFFLHVLLICDGVTF